jgi:hypothetical protein
LRVTKCLVTDPPTDRLTIKPIWGVWFFSKVAYMTKLLEEAR